MTRSNDPDQRYFAFIRAINVGRRRLTNEQLIEPFIQLGFDDVAAYQTAGNITFRTGDPSRVRPNQLNIALADALGLSTEVFVRSIDELRAIAQRRPFSDEQIAPTEGRVQVSFLHDPPTDRTVEEVLALAMPDDRIAFSGREWFWLPARDIAESRLPVPAIEGVLGSTTMRTLGTVTRMLSKFDRG